MASSPQSRRRYHGTPEQLLEVMQPAIKDRSWARYDESEKAEDAKVKVPEIGQAQHILQCLFAVVK